MTIVKKNMIVFCTMAALFIFPCAATAHTFEDLKKYSLEKINEGVAYVTISMNDNSSDNKFAKLWNSSIDKMEEGLDYLNEVDDKEYKEWYRIGQKPKFRSIIKETFEILSISDAKERIDIVIEHRKEIASLHKENSELAKRMPSAPDKAEGLLDFALDKINMLDTKTAIDKAIAKNKEKITELERNIEEIKRDFYSDMRSKGMPVSPEQIEALFSSIDGEGIIAIIGMSQNIKTIQLELQKLISKESGNIELLKSYAGIYMMLNESLLFAYEEIIEKINTLYIPKLTDIIDTSRKELAIAQNKSNSTAKHNQGILQANIKANAMTIHVGERYKAYLEKQILFLSKEKKQMQDNVEVATNTYNTIKNGGELLILIKESESDLARVTSFQIPELAILHDEALRREFNAITSRLQI